MLRYATSYPSFHENIRKMGISLAAAEDKWNKVKFLMNLK